ncbi:MAG: nucleotidyltransferase domain-containing protein [Clostridiales bacterium]|nr:nucleotidyltransferase domain-containing protein [Clostridiales bacterium]
MNYGLKEADIEYIIHKISERNEIDKAVIFGSRAKGINRPGSDIDIVIYGDNVSFDTISSLHSILEEQGPLPYFFDIIDYSSIKNEELKEHIDRIGKVIFER